MLLDREEVMYFAKKIHKERCIFCNISRCSHLADAVRRDISYCISLLELTSPL